MKKHGGKRKGSGRKAKKHRTKTFRLATDVADKLDIHKGYDTATEMVEDAVRKV